MYTYSEGSSIQYKNTYEYKIRGSFILNLYQQQPASHQRLAIAELVDIATPLLLKHCID